MKRELLQIERDNEEIITQIRDDTGFEKEEIEKNNAFNMG